MRRYVIVDLGAPASDIEMVPFGRTIVQLMEKAARFANPPIPYATVKAHLDTYATDQQNVALRGPGATALRDASRVVVIQDLMMLRAFVQMIAQASPADAAAIAGTAGMSLRESTGRHRAELAVRCTAAGVVVLTARAAGRNAAYFWQYSLDGENWISVPETLQATTTITGLPSHQLVYFRFRALTRKGPKDYSQVVSQLVS